MRSRSSRWRLIATVKQAEAVISDQGQVDRAKLNLTYARITAPITGRLGLRLVDPGNIVHASDPKGLVVLTQMHPISVLFTIAQDQLPAVLQKMRAGQKLQADAFDREMQKTIGRGTLTTVDNQIDPTTGTVRLRATFENAMGACFPTSLSTLGSWSKMSRGIVLSPARQSNDLQCDFRLPRETGFHGTVRNITIGIIEGETAQITSGLAPGEVVVMTGADRLQEGSKVAVRIPRAENAAPRGRQAGAAQAAGARSREPVSPFILRPVATSLLMAASCSPARWRTDSSRVGAAGSRLPDHSGDHVLSGGEP